MKRLSPRELLLVSAPLGIVALGIWGARLREERWPTKPRIVARPRTVAPPRIVCRVRPATPLEVFLGAQVGVTVEAVAPYPNTNSCNSSLRYSLLGSHNGSAKFNATEEVRYDEHSKIEIPTLKIEENHAYNWKNLSSQQSPRVAGVSVSSVCNAYPTIHQQFELSTKGVKSPDAVAARRANFRVTKAILSYTARKSSVRFEISLGIGDVSDESQGIMTRPECVGKWGWQDKGHPFTPVHGSVGSYSSSIGSPSSVSGVTIYLDVSGARWPPMQGTKFRGLLSVSEGWPQEIEVEVTGKRGAYSSLLDLKFSTKLAPLPSARK